MVSQWTSKIEASFSVCTPDNCAYAQHALSCRCLAFIPDSFICVASIHGISYHPMIGWTMIPVWVVDSRQRVRGRIKRFWRAPGYVSAEFWRTSFESLRKANACVAIGKLPGIWSKPYESSRLWSSFHFFNSLSCIGHMMHDLLFSWHVSNWGLMPNSWGRNNICFLSLFVFWMWKSSTLIWNSDCRGNLLSS